MIKRILFDIDGTLITGVNFKECVYNTLYEVYGIEDINFTNKFLESINIYEKLYNSYDKKDYLNFFSNILGLDFDEDFLYTFFRNLSKVVPDDSESIRRTLDLLVDYNKVLISNYFEESQRGRLKTMGIDDYFSEYYGEKLIKPNKEVFDKARGVYLPGECLIVGDNYDIDIRVPNEMGFHTCLVDKNGNGDINCIEELTPERIKIFEKNKIN